MNAREDLFAKYVTDLKDNCGIIPDTFLLTKVIVDCGSLIKNTDSSTVTINQKEELDDIKNNFLINKLGLSDGAELDKGIDAVIEKHGRSNKNKYRAVVYYLLTRHFNKECVYQ